MKTAADDRRLNLRIHPLRERHVENVAHAFANFGWDKPASQYHRYLSEQNRDVLALYFTEGLGP